MTRANACAGPTELADEAWIPAAVPGTTAAALRASGVWSGEAPLELDEHDIWYRGHFAGGAEETLRFEGLATIADVWLNGAYLLRAENMSLAHEVSARTWS